MLLKYIVCICLGAKILVFYGILRDWAFKLCMCFLISNLNEGNVSHNLILRGKSFQIFDPRYFIDLRPQKVDLTRGMLTLPCVHDLLVKA